MTDIYETKWPASTTFAEPVSDTPLGDIVRASERATRLGGNMVSEAAAREEAYDRRIEAIRQVTGVALENPERGGYSIDARKAIRREVIAGGMSPIDEKGGIPAYQKRIFDQKVAELQAKYPDLEFGGLDEEARAIGAEAQQGLARASDQPVNPILKFGAEFIGGMWGSRRDPLFLGSLFAGPTTAVGKTALARIARSAFNQGLFNAGVAALEQPAVQDWHAKIGVATGLKPAVEDVGMAFLTGAIPGAVFGAGHEAWKASAPSVRRLLRGEPEPGDIKAATEALAPQPAPPREPVVASAQSSVEAGVSLEPRPVPEGEIKGSEYFTIKKDGNEIARVRLLPGDSPDERHISWIGQREPSEYGASTEANALGPAIIRAALRQYRELHPEVTRLTGERISGARASGEEIHINLPSLQERAMRAGEDSLAADHAVLDEKPPAAPQASEMTQPITASADLPEGATERPGGYRVPINDNDGNRIGRIDIDLRSPTGQREVIQIVGAEIDEGHRGQGYGIKAYQQIADFALAQGKELWSDRSLSPDAMRMYESLRNMGYTVIEQDANATPFHAQFKVTAGPDQAIGQTPAGLYNDLVAAALKRADDPGAPSPEATAAVERPTDPELQARIDQANPRTPQEAMAAADETLDDFGRRDGMAEIAERMRKAREDQDELTEAYMDIEFERLPVVYHGTGRTFEKFDTSYSSHPTGVTFFTDNDAEALKFGASKRVIAAKLNLENPMRINAKGELYNTEKMNDALRAAKDAGHDGLIVSNIKNFADSEPTTTYAVFNADRIVTQGRKDIANKIPMMRDDGTIALRSERAVKSDGDIEDTLAALVRECKE